jgi:predicted exporter
MWFANDGSAVLMAETRATAVDIAGQAAAIAAVSDAFAKLAGADQLTLEMSGAGVFGVELQKTIRAEAQKRSILATVALLVVLFAFFRSIRYLFLATVPIGMGFLVGLAVVALLFETVHGITLAFGFTLMGVAIDYPLHLFSHAQKSDGITAIRRIWPTLQLGALSTAIAYVALSFSGSDGLAQLGAFTAAGIAVAVLATRAWVPYLMDPSSGSGDHTAEETPVTLRYLPAIGLAGIALVAASQVVTDSLWDDDLTSLSPVPQERLADDIRLRSAAGTSDMRYQLFVHNRSLDALLERGEDIDALLEGALDDGLVDGWQSLTRVLPSQATQEARRARIPDAQTLAADLQQALTGTPFRRDAFQPFLDGVRRSAELPVLGAAGFGGTPLQAWRDAHLVSMAGEWVSLISLQGPDANALAERVAGWGDDVSLLDLRESSFALMRDYRASALTTVGFAALIIIGLLWYQRRQPSQVLWIALSVTAGLAMTIAVVVAVHDQLTVIHLVALLLVTGLGLDYSLFLSRSESEEERAATNKAILACAASTTVAFGILSGSSIPVLKFLGLTVAAGSVCNYLAALAGTRNREVEQLSEP